MVSHTTTGEWQSFEARMRRRRAERLLLRAEAAFDAGCLDDARQCVAEARALAPSFPGLGDVEQKLSAPLSAVKRGATPRRIAAVAAFAIAITVGLAGWTLVPGTNATAEIPAPPPAPIAAAPSQSPAAPIPDPLPAPAALFTAETAAAPRPDPIPPPIEPETPRIDTIAPTAKPDVSDVMRQEAVDVATRLETPVSRIDPLMPRTVTEEALRALPLPTAPPPAAPPPPPEPPQQPAVRSVLERYAAAYSALDVDAAQRVWPGVNRGALARAFDSLAMQQVLLGDCRIDIDGSSATARCVATTTWAPKIGSGDRHTETRDWTFELTRAGAGWEIVSARLQNR
jgi:hypothetical protein